MPKRPKRDRTGERNRGAVFVDLDNLRRTLEEYRLQGAPLLTLSDLLDWIERPESLGLTSVWRTYVFGTYRQHLRPPGPETLLERRHRNTGTVKMINYPMPTQRGMPGYEDADMLRIARATQAYWDTAVFVSSDHVVFEWAERIRRDEAPFSRKEALVVYSLLSTSTYVAAQADNAQSIEEIFPDLLMPFISHRRHHPLVLRGTDRLSA